jgi:hypothetical protein
LFQIIAAGYATGGFPGSLNRRQQQGDQNADDGDHNQQFHKRKTRMAAHIAILYRNGGQMSL